jgi:hypothetical protein
MIVIIELYGRQSSCTERLVSLLMVEGERCYRIEPSDEGDGLPFHDFEDGTAHRLLPRVDVAVRENYFRIRKLLQQLIDKENTRDILNGLATKLVHSYYQYRMREEESNHTV